MMWTTDAFITHLEHVYRAFPDETDPVIRDVVDSYRTGREEEFWTLFWFRAGCEDGMTLPDARRLDALASEYQALIDIACHRAAIPRRIVDLGTRWVDPNFWDDLCDRDDLWDDDLWDVAP
jgi:hypothetical protein